MTARDVIAQFLQMRDESVFAWEVSDEERAASADALIGALHASGYRILAPGQLDDETLEAAAKVADEAQEMRERLFAENQASINASKAVQAEEIANAIRNLKEKPDAR